MSDLKPPGVKVPYALLPLSSLAGVCRVLEHGASKYAPWNWATPKSEDWQATEYLSAALRHLASAIGEGCANNTDESGLPHIDHAITSLIIARYHLTNSGRLKADPGKHVVQRQLPLPFPSRPPGSL